MKIAFIIPGDLDQPTGGYIYDRNIIENWWSFGYSVDVINLPGDFPFPKDQDKIKSLDIVTAIASVDVVIVDGLAGGALPQLMEQLSHGALLIALLHHPLCLESGLTKAQQEQLKDSEAAGLKCVDAIVTTSAKTAGAVQELFDVSDKNLRAFEPGVRRGSQACSWSHGPIRLLCVGSLIERKNHRTLIEALAEMKELNWVLDCYGSKDFDPKLAAEIEDLIKAHELDDRICLHGVASEAELDKAFANSHLFVLPSLYEGYGMVFAEAVASGLPVVSFNAGAIPDTVPDGCGLLVNQEPKSEFFSALKSLIEDHALRESMHQNCLDSADQFPTWEATAQSFIEFVGQIK